MGRFDIRRQATRVQPLAVVLLSCVALAAAGDGQVSGRVAACCRADAEENAPAVGRQKVVVPDVTLVGMDGSRVGLRQELDCGKPVMLNFIFTTCTTICPVMSATFAQVQEDLGGEQGSVRMVSISIDPEHDTPSRLRVYAAARNAGREWHFLTGEPATVEAVQKAFDAFRGSKFNHAALTFLRKPGEEEWVRLEGLRSAENLEAEYRRLMAGR
jgi:protein SCO1/2